MSTIMPEGKRIQDAIKWIDEELREKHSLREALNLAGPRFNLTPKESEFLKKFFLEQEKNG